MKNDRGFANILVVIGLLFIVAVGGYFAFGPKTRPSEGCIKVVGGVVGILNECKSVSECDFYKKSGYGFMDDCYWGVAVKNDDVSICSLIGNDPQKTGCLENIAEQIKTKEGLLTIVSPDETSGPFASPIRVVGLTGEKWTVFEGVAGTVTLYDDNDNKLGQSQLTADTDWTRPPVHFVATVDFSPPSTNSGRLEFLDDNPSGDPTRQQRFTMPVRLVSVPAETKKINLFFYNQTKDREIADYMPCSRDAVLPVIREVPLTKTPVQDAVNLLLKGGLTDTEKLSGFQTEFPLAGFSLAGANLKDGTLTLQFKDLENRSGGGSCRVGLLWAQISKTALQFSGVKEVKFSPETLFQP